MSNEGHLASRGPHINNTGYFPTQSLNFSRQLGVNGSLTRPDTQMRSNANDTNMLSSIEHMISGHDPVAHVEIPFIYS